MREIMTTPIPVQKSTRVDQWRGLTSMRAGVIQPIAFFPLLREDRIRGQIGVQIRMEEALHTIINPIRVTVQAHLVSKIAFERFEGSMETLNRSYKNELMPGGAAAPAWYLADPNLAGLAADDLGHKIYDSLGIHYKKTGQINTDVLEAYWTMVNWRRAEVSDSLTPFPVTTNDLAPAFWNNQRFGHIKPSFDDLMMEGAIELNLQGVMPVEGYTASKSGAGAATAAQIQGGADSVSVFGTNAGVTIEFDPDGPSAVPGKGLRVNLAASSGVMTLANFELARQTQAMAKMRERYQGIADQYLVDLLMSGISVPAEEFRKPLLLGMQSTVINQMERYATDGASLDQSVTNGVAQLGLTIATPSVNPGGVVIVTCEIVPEQLYERVNDSALDFRGGKADTLPDYLRDYLDPQKVVVVENQYADEFHPDPTGVFGYAPLNHEWQRSFARVGGRYKRPVADGAFVEDRARIWAVEKTDLSLSEDFYVCPQPFPHDVFADADADPFEVICVANMEIVGNTVFGAGFEEDGDNYEKVLAQVDQGRISSEAPAATETAETPAEGGDA